MRNLLVSAVLAPAMILLSGAAPVPAPAPDIIDQLIEKATEAYGSKGFKPTGWTTRGSLAEGQTRQFNVTLKGGSQFHVVGMCDGNCGDLNAVLTKGDEIVDSDTKDDDFPIVATNGAGSYTLTVSMEKCGATTCNFALIAFGK